MITKIQSINNKHSFKNNGNADSKDLVEYKRKFLKDHFEKQYKTELKSFTLINLVSSLAMLGWAGYDYAKGNKGRAISAAVVAIVSYPIMQLFKPKKEKYDIKLQEEFNKLST